jgi:cytochrome P450
LLQPFFLPGALAQFEPISRRIAVPLIEALLQGEGRDFAHGLARPLPPQVLLARLGQPVDDWARIKDCSEASYLQGSSDPADVATYEAANAYLWEYSYSAVSERRRNPRDPKSDLISAMLAGAIDGAPVDEALVAGMIRLLLAAGHDSTTSALGICLRFLAEHADAQQHLRARPEDIPDAVEEILRLQAPVVQMPRAVARDVELGGKSLKQGDRVLLVFASGNRDEAKFEHPEQCRLDRSPNRHLSFGTGIHVCIGNGLARQEIKVALEELLARTESFGLSGEPTREFWHPYGATRLVLWTQPSEARAVP